MGNPHTYHHIVFINSAFGEIRTAKKKIPPSASNPKRQQQQRQYTQELGPHRYRSFPVILFSFCFLLRSFFFQNNNNNMMLSSTLARQVARPTATRLQRRTFLDWMTHYPDRINEMKKQYQAGGRTVFTWLKQPNDKAVAMLGAGLVTLGFLQLIPGYYRLATGKGKIE